MSGVGIVSKIIGLLLIVAAGMGSMWVLRDAARVAGYDVYPGKWFTAAAVVNTLLCGVAAVVVVLQ